MFRTSTQDTTTLYRQNWVVYAKRPFGGAKQVFAYLGRRQWKFKVTEVDAWVRSGKADGAVPVLIHTALWDEDPAVRLGAALALFLLCPGWKKFGTVRVVKPDTVILHSRADDVVPYAHSEELVKSSGLPASALIEVGTDHWLADMEAQVQETTDRRQGKGSEGRHPRRKLRRQTQREFLRVSPRTARHLEPGSADQVQRGSRTRGCCEWPTRGSNGTHAVLQKLWNLFRDRRLWKYRSRRKRNPGPTSARAGRIKGVRYYEKPDGIKRPLHLVVPFPDVGWIQQARSRS